jgi:hypothetical protein
MAVHPIGVHLMSVHHMGVHLRGIHVMDVPLIGVYSMGDYSPLLPILASLWKGQKERVRYVTEGVYRVEVGASFKLPGVI